MMASISSDRLRVSLLLHNTADKFWFRHSSTRCTLFWGSQRLWNITRQFPLRRIIGRCKGPQCVCSPLYIHCMWPSAPWFSLLKVSLLWLFWGWRMGKMVGVGRGFCMGPWAQKNKTKREPQSPAWGAKCSCPANEILKWAIMPP